MFFRKNRKWEMLILVGVLVCSMSTVQLLLLEYLPNIVFAAEQGNVCWEQDERSFIEAYGYGSIPEGKEGTAQGRILARLAATVDAKRNLTEIIRGVQVDSETTMKDLIIQDDTVHVKVQGLLKGAEVIKEIQETDGAYCVLMKVPLYGRNSLAATAIPAVRTAERKHFPSVSKKYKEDVLLQEIQEKEYTGVIIDARGLGLNPTFSPVILDDSGRKIYGHENIDADYAVTHGMVGYAKEISETEKGISRVGITPLRVKAVRLEGHNCNVVITQHDADIILAMNQKYGFLENCAVVFIR